MNGSYSLNTFDAWATKGSWDALKEHLTSQGLRVVDPKDKEYAVVRYEKGKTDFKANPIASSCRSVVVEKSTGRVVAVAPVKAVAGTDDAVKSAWRVETFVDGTMVNVFWRIGSEEEPQVCTRSRLGALSKFQEKRSFADQFKEACEKRGVTDLKALLTAPHTGGTEGIQTVFATFVLQHPDNRIVTPVSEPTMFLVQMGWVNKAETTVYILENPELYGAQGKALAPELYDASGAWQSVEEVNKWVQETAQTEGYGWQGVVIKDGKGGRCRFRSDLYQVVRKLRGNENTGYERFARLRSTRNTTQYLAFYPEDTDSFYALEGRLRAQTRKLVAFYADTFKTRKQAYHELPWPFKYHVSVLHNLYKEKLKPNGKVVDLEAVIRYVNNLKIEDMANLLKEVQVKAPVEAEPQNEQVNAE